MELLMEIIGNVLPIVIVGGIAIFIIKKLEHKQKQGKTGRKNSNEPTRFTGQFDTSRNAIWMCSWGYI